MASDDIEQFLYDPDEDLDNHGTGMNAAGVAGDDGLTAQDKGRPKRKPAFLWNTAKKDLTLLKEVQLILPFKAIGRLEKHKKWVIVGDNINQYFGTTISSIAVYRRFVKLVQDHKRADSKNRYKSGVEEEDCAVKDILTELVGLLDAALLEEAELTTATQKKKDCDMQKADEIRHSAMQTFSKRKLEPTSPTETKSPKLSWDKSLLAIYEKNQEAAVSKAEAEAKQKQQEIEERQKDREIELKKIDIQQQMINQQNQQWEAGTEERKLLIGALLLLAKK